MYIYKYSGVWKVYQVWLALILKKYFSQNVVKLTVSPLPHLVMVCILSDGIRP